ncbi:RNA polymerase subunit sigma, partial [Xylella fastidiosa subsp. multiplex]|nr:RNA polymerase subunit sigma [Xylella fastidiosa subsp. multiplex]
FATLASLYVDYRPWLVDRLRFRLRNHADAEDLASETFLQVATGREPAAIAEPKAYLSTIAQRQPLQIGLFQLAPPPEVEQQAP